MKHWPFPIALGILTLLKLSQFSLAAGGEESKLREPFNKAVKTEKRQRQQPLIKVALVSIPDSKYSERFPLISLDRSLFQRIA